jgi:hypothetical protein
MTARLVIRCRHRRSSARRSGISVVVRDTVPLEIDDAPGECCGACVAAGVTYDVGFVSTRRDWEERESAERRVTAGLSPTALKRYYDG